MTFLQLVLTILFLLVLGEGAILLTYHLWKIVIDSLKSTKTPDNTP